MNTGNEPPQPVPDAPGNDNRGRNPQGEYTPTRATAQRDAQAADLRAQGHTYQQIADTLGYCDRGEAHHAVRRAMRDIVREPAERLLAVHMERLETLYEAALEVLEADHVVVSHGRIIKDDDGKPLKDTGPKLAAIREARATLDSFWTLTGMKKPAKVEHSGNVKYEVVGVDPQDLV